MNLLILALLLSSNALFCADKLKFFFVDVEGHISNAKVKAALQECEARASMLKVLGSYPAAVI